MRDSGNHRSGINAWKFLLEVTYQTFYLTYVIPCITNPARGCMPFVEAWGRGGENS